MNQSKTNILLVVLDTCRFDVFDEVLQTGVLQNFNELINDSIYYRNAISSSPWTTPSHVSLFTGLYPSEHNVHEGKNLKQSSMIMKQIFNFPGNLLSEIIRNNGYHTYGFVANPNLAPGTGFERGFDYLSFVDMFDEFSELWNNTRQKIKVKFPKSEEDIISLAHNFSINDLIHFAKSNWNILKLPSIMLTYRNFLDKAQKLGYPKEKAGRRIANIISDSSFESPFFLFINFMEMHDPYKLNRGEFFSGEGKKMLSYLVGDNDLSYSLLSNYKELYKQELILLDKYIGKVITKLKKDGVYDNTTIVITADHGQNFGEDHFYGHGILLSDSLIRVPLIVKIKGSNKKNVNEKFQPHINLFKFLIQCSEGMVEPSIISDEVAYSESFGVQEDFREMFKFNLSTVDKIERYDHRSVAIYYNDIKVILSIKDNMFHIDSMVSNNENKSIGKIEKEEINKLIKKFLGFKFVSVDQTEENKNET